jgi:hypothetical protein
METATHLLVTLPDGVESMVKLSQPRTLPEIWAFLRARQSRPRAPLGKPIGMPMVVSMAHGSTTALVSF